LDKIKIQDPKKIAQISKKQRKALEALCDLTGIEDL
jgi:hypothetical protein